MIALLIKTRVAINSIETQGIKLPSLHQTSSTGT